MPDLCCKIIVGGSFPLASVLTLDLGGWNVVLMFCHLLCKCRKKKKRNKKSIAYFLQFEAADVENQMLATICVQTHQLCYCFGGSLRIVEGGSWETVRSTYSTLSAQKLLFCAEPETWSYHLSADIATGKVGAACTGTAGTQGNCGTNAVCSTTSVCQCEDGFTGPVAGDCVQYTTHAFMLSFMYHLSFVLDLSRPWP